MQLLWYWSAPTLTGTTLTAKYTAEHYSSWRSQIMCFPFLWCVICCGFYVYDKGLQSTMSIPKGVIFHILRCSWRAAFSFVIFLGHYLTLSHSTYLAATWAGHKTILVAIKTWKSLVSTTSMSKKVMLYSESINYILVNEI